MFSKVLVANRGEIAVRVVRACRELGISTVAVFSEVDASAFHVRLADEACPLGGRSAGESYLNAEAVVAAARTSGAEAIHPGYGFLAENADFARAVNAAGLVFIGPPPGAIEIMGDKLSARAAAARAGVASVPGTEGALARADEVVAFADVHGWPVAIKAAYGGGGRGMRVVSGPAEAAGALESAQSEALAGFGRRECYVEKYLEWPRHVEMQVMADTAGRYVWLGERDCSTQRRHQKLIEESPAPEFPGEVRQAMGDAAVRVAQACGYVNAGTVEFLYEDGRFWFLEMNTRLQVEHPVTEMVTGIDLVAEQIRVAAGEPLRFTQADVSRRGHAIECRINAEDPAGGQFVPCPGVIADLVVPQGFGVRWDGGYEAGDEVSSLYDNLIGKLVVWGADRSAAIARMERCLVEMRLEGIATTIPAHLAILRDPDFAAARHSTRWVEEHLRSRLTTQEVEKRDRNEVQVAGRWYVIPRFDLGTGGPPRRRPVTGVDAAAGSGQLTSPMQGTVVKVLVETGDKVEAGQPVCMLEAMKMETTLTAGRTGSVTAVHAVAGQPVRAGELLLVIT